MYEMEEKNFFLKKTRTTQKYSQNLYAKVIVLFVLILYICPSYITVDAVSYIVEEDDYGPESQPQVFGLSAYDDGTVAIRIVRNYNISCLYDTFFLRIIYPNGTVIKKDIKLEDVQQFNYCNSIREGYTATGSDKIKYELIRTNQILVIYADYFNYTHVNVSGMIIDFDGNVLDRTYIKFTQLTQLPLGLKLNINRDKGFIIYDDLDYYSKINDDIDLTSPIISWQQYRIEPSGTFIKLTGGEFKLNVFNDFQWESMFKGNPMMSTVNEDYAYVYALTSPRTNSTTNLLIAAVLINYNKSESATVLLYHDHSQEMSVFELLICNIEYVGVGQYCTLLYLSGGSLSTLRINFLSSGSVVSFVSSNNPNIINPSIETGSSLKSLPYGGFLIITTDSKDIVHVKFFDDKGAAGGSTAIRGIKVFGIHASLMLPNNTLLIPQSGPDNNTWTLNVIDVPKYTNRNIEYFNTNIESTFPTINGSLIFSDITNISINFYDPVELSDGKLSIYYQPNGQGKILRQSTSCTSIAAQCTLDKEYKRVTVKVLDSVLSESGGNYFIEIDNKFVIDRVYEEPLLGIKENIWKFTINDSKKQYPIISSISGLLRLNAEGTDKIGRLKSNERNEFFNALLGELADVILIPKERLSKDSKEQFDPDSKDRKLLLVSITIIEVKNHNEKDVNTTMYDLKNMMANNEQTLIGQGDFTKYLDFTFGFKPKPNYWQEYKLKLLGAFLAIIILVILYIFARLRSKNKKKEGRNFAIFQFALIIFDFVMDILFITNNANDFPKLYTPSLIFFTLPIASNTMLAFLTIIKENAKPKFSEWFEKNIKFASIFTILAGADIEILNLLHSNLAGFEVFNAPLSESAEHKIFWGSLLNIFIEDVPQLIIQILYRKYSITYDIIPILNLISSAINLIVKIVGRLYQAIKNVQDRNKRNTNVSDG